jgi:hypothetical protein
MENSQASFIQVAIPGNPRRSSKATTTNSKNRSMGRSYLFHRQWDDHPDGISGEMGKGEGSGLRVV